MRAANAFLTGLLVLVLAVCTGAVPLFGAEESGPALTLPAVLDAQYPPVAGQPLFLFRMIELETSFSGIAVDLQEGDLEGARSSFRDFERLYRETSELVPEWRGEYPEKPVRDLGEAVTSGDRDRAMGAIAVVGEGCHRCHGKTMVPVQQKYRWGNFGGLAVRDPLSETSVEYPLFKRFLAANLAGITINLRQGQIDNARRQFQEFRSRFLSLANTCGGCHEGESRAFADRQILEEVEALGKEFRTDRVDPEAATARIRNIGKESCSKCHLVHVPAAMAAATLR